MGETKHAPLPWKLAQHGLTPGSCLLHDWHIEDADGKLVGWIPQRNRASAGLIVLACNNHAGLLEALVKLERWAGYLTSKRCDCGPIPSDPQESRYICAAHRDVARAEAAIAKAERELT